LFILDLGLGEDDLEGEGYLEKEDSSGINKSSVDFLELLDLEDGCVFLVLRHTAVIDVGDASDNEADLSRRDCDGVRLRCK
jgi:hypothetical protein